LALRLIVGIADAPDQLRRKSVEKVIHNQPMQE